jgi:hypothetical protein
MNEGNFAEACPKLSKSQALDPQVGTMLNLALCYQSLGETASACGWWRDAAAAAAGKSQHEREQFAREQMDATCPPTTAGPREPAPAPAEAAPPPPQSALPSMADPRSVPSDSSTGGMALRTNSGRRAGLTTAAWVTGGSGVAVIGAAAAFGVAAWVNRDASNQLARCVGKICNGEGFDDRNRAVRDAEIANIGLAVGAGILTVGVALWLLDRRPHPSSSLSLGLSLQPRVAHGSWSMTVGQAW